MNQVSSLVNLRFPDQKSADKFVRENKDALRVQNPRYTTALSYGRSVFATNGIPRWVSGIVTHPSDPTLVSVPRAWYFSNPQAPAVEDYSIDMRVSWPAPALSLLEHQQEALSKVISAVDANDNAGRPTDGLVIMPPSSGKTILGLALGFHLDTRVLAVVPTQEIEQAWIKDFSRVYPNLDPSKIGRIRGKKLRIGEHLTVGSIQTLMNLDPDLWASEFGCVIFDECHRMPAEKFSNALKASRAAVRLGLTATPRRKDGMMPSLRWHLGENLYLLDKPFNSVPLVYCWVPSASNPMQPTAKNPNPDFDWTAAISYLCNDRDRNLLIVDLVLHIRATYPGDILIASSRTDHIEELAGFMPERTAILTGAISGKKRQELYAAICAGEYPITIATTSLISEGASNPKWHHVIQATPYSDPKTAIQLSGRCIRKDRHKEFGYYWDISDRSDPMRNMSKTRYTTLKKRMHHSVTFSTTRDSAGRYSFIPKPTILSHEKGTP